MPLTWTPHPALPPLSKSELLRMTPESILAYWEKREEAIKLEKEDPYRHGFELDTWKLADKELKTHSEILLMGGNRAGGNSNWNLLLISFNLYERNYASKNSNGQIND